MTKKKILFINDEMVMGGVARILNTLLNQLDYNKYDVDLLVLHKHGEMLKEIPSKVNVIGGSNFFKAADIPLRQCKVRDLYSKFRLITYMKSGMIKRKIMKERSKIIKERYDVEFSAKEGFCTIFTAFGNSKRKINWIQVDYKESNYSINHMKLMKEALEKIDENIACSHIVKESYKDLFKIDNITVVNNLIDDILIRDMSMQEIGSVEDKRISLICVARFHHQKGLDRLINVYARLKEYYSLTIIGNGELREQLYKQAQDLDVFDEIKWLGMQQNPYKYIRASDLFVLPSLYEGFPTITIESLISKTPVLALRVAGIDEQITKEEYGWVIENSEEALYDKLNDLKFSITMLKKYKDKLNTFKYDNESIMKKYDDIFEGGNINV